MLSDIKKEAKGPFMVFGKICMVVWAILIVLFVKSCITYPIKDNPAQDAEFACMGTVERFLNDPDSAKWDYENSYGVNTKTPDVYVAFVTLHARNGFNALIKAEYRCTVHYDKPDKTYIVDTLLAI